MFTDREKYITLLDLIHKGNIPDGCPPWMTNKEVERTIKNIKRTGEKEKKMNKERKRGMDG